MSTDKAINHFGSAASLAKALGLSKAAVSQWGEYVPALRAYQLERITKGALVVEDQDFKKAS